MFGILSFVSSSLPPKILNFLCLKWSNITKHIDLRECDPATALCLLFNLGNYNNVDYYIMEDKNWKTIIFITVTP